QGKPALDATIAGAQAVEDDPKVNSVGFGGLPNSIGTVQLDACVMDGRTLACGAVAALENIRHPAALARRVMEKTPHVLPVGVGDSPIIGAGLYVDDSAGAAGATGVGEEIIRVGGSLLIVEALRGGKSPQEACELAVRRVNASALRRGVHPARVAFLALD